MNEGIGAISDTALVCGNLLYIIPLKIQVLCFLCSEKIDFVDTDFFFFEW